MMLQTKCEVRQSWAACFFLVHWGCLRLGGLEPWLWSFGICLKLLRFALGKLEPWLWSFSICLKWLELWLWSFGRLEPWLWWNGLGLFLEGMHLVSFWPLMLIMCIHLWWAQVMGLEWLKKQFSVSIKSRVQSQAFGLEFIHSIQGSNNYDGLKHWTWAHHGSNNIHTHVQCNAIYMDRPKGRFCRSLQHR